MITHGNPLQTLVNPNQIAVIGNDALTRNLLQNLAAGNLNGKIHYVGREPIEIQGVTCHTDLEEIPGQIALVAVTSNPTDFIGILGKCAGRGAKHVILYSADVGREQMQLSTTAARLGIRLFGPTAFGCILPHACINMTPFSQTVPAGNLALVSQSTSVCANILDWNHNDEFGFSAIFGYGHSSDIELPEILDYLAADLKTESILLYLEGLHDTRRFLSAVRAAAAVKPVIALKGGQNPASASVAAAHSGANVGRDDAFDAALRRVGVLRVVSIGDMFSTARALATPKKPRGNRLAIVTNGGSPSIMALDLITELGIVAANLTDVTLERLRAQTLAPWSTGNPVDIGFNASPENWFAAIAACADDPCVDGVLAILTPNQCAEPLVYAKMAIEGLGETKKPILACLLGEVRSQAARAAFARARFPVFRTPEHAISAFAYLVNWVRNQKLMLETPTALSSYAEPNTAQAKGIIDEVLQTSRRTLSLPEAKRILQAFCIPVTPSESASTPTEAVTVANRIGYPVAMKNGDSRQVWLSLRSAAEVALAFRMMCTVIGAKVHIEPFVDRTHLRWLLISIRLDEVFGPVIALSENGIAPEIYDARSIALPPLNPRLVGDMLSVPHVAKLLGPLWRKPAVALAPLQNVLLRVSEMASELPWLQSLEVTLAVDDQDAVVVDAQIEVRPFFEGARRYSHMAIYPYPSQLVADWKLKNNSICTIRPIRPDDAAQFQNFIRNLTANSRYSRFFSTINELSQSALARLTQLDYARELTLIALAPWNGQTRILGEANFTCLQGGNTCEFAIVIADDMAGYGLGSRLMRCLMAAAREQDIKVMRGEVLADNEAMLALIDALDFIVKLTDEERIVEVSREL